MKIAAALVAGVILFPVSRSLGAEIGGGFLLNQADFRPILHDYPIDGVAIGQGWDSFLNRKSPEICVSAEQTKLIGNSISAKFKRIDDREHIFNSLSVSASGSYGGGSFSVSGAASFAKSTTVDTTALNILASVSVDTGGLFIIPPKSKGDVNAVGAGAIKLTDSALKLAREDMAAFVRQCGDSFVMTIREGGELNALLKASTYSREEQQKISISIRAKGLMASGGADINQELKTLQQQDRLEVDFLQSGGDPSVIPLDALALVQKISGFGNREKFISRPYQLLTLNYKNTSNWPNVQLPASPQRLEMWAALYWRLQDLANQYKADALDVGSRQLPSHDDRDSILATVDRIQNVQRFIDLNLLECVENKICDIERSLPKVINALKLANGGKHEYLSTLVESSFGLTMLAKAQLSQNEIQSITSPAVAVEIEAIKRSYSKDKVSRSNRKIEVSPLSPGKSGSALSLSENGFTWFYRWLGEKPLRSGEIDLKKLMSIEEFNGQVDDTARINLASARYLAKVVEVRMLPLSSGFCELSVSHPMCFTVSDLNKIAGSLQLKLTLAKFKPDVPPPPPAPPPPPPRREPPERDWGPCPHNPTICI